MTATESNERSKGTKINQDTSGIVGVGATVGDGVDVNVGALPRC